MELYIALISVFLIGFIASFVGSMVGSGGLLTIPFLIFVGLSPAHAIGTNKLAALGLQAGAGIKYFTEKRIVWRYVVPFSIISIIGSYIGARILVAIDKENLSIIVGLILLLLLPTLFVKKSIGTKRKRITSTMKYIGYVLYFLTMVWAGFFGGGYGTMAFYIMMVFFGLTIIEASATNKIPGLFTSIISVTVFAISGIVNYMYGFVMMAGTFIGGYMGARYSIKKGEGFVKILFAAIVIASSIKLIFFR